MGRERRRSPRCYEPFPVTLFAGAAGRRLALDTLTDNISGDGLCLHLPRAFGRGDPPQLGAGSWVTLVVCLRPVCLGAGPDPARVAIAGEVVRAEQQPGGAYSVGVRIRRKKFL